MKKRGLIGVIVLLILLSSISCIALTKTPPPPPKTYRTILLEEVERSNMTEEEKQARIENISEQFEDIDEQLDKIEEKREEYIEKQEEEEAEKESQEPELALKEKGEETEQDYLIRNVSISPSSDIATIRICNTGDPIEKVEEGELAISIRLKKGDDFVEIARLKPMLKFDDSQCTDAMISTRALYYKYDIKRKDTMKFIVDADGKYRERNEDNNIFEYIMGSERIIDNVYRIEGSVKEGPLSPKLSDSQTAAAFGQEGICSDINVGGTEHNVCLMSDNFLVSKITVDGIEDSIIHLWSWDWIKASAGGIEAETSGEFFIFTQV